MKKVIETWKTWSAYQRTTVVISAVGLLLTIPGAIVFIGFQPPLDESSVTQQATEGTQQGTEGTQRGTKEEKRIEEGKRRREETQRKEDEKNGILRVRSKQRGRCGAGVASPQGWWQVVPPCNETGGWLVDCDRRVKITGIKTVPEFQKARRLCEKPSSKK